MTDNHQDTTRPKLLYVVSEDWYFLSHRLPMAQAARAAGFDVHVATRVMNHGSVIAEKGFTVHDVRFVRGTFSPVSSARTIWRLARLIRTVDPAIIHNVSLQCSVIGSAASIGRQTPTINAITGLGSLFTSDAPAWRLAGLAAEIVLRAMTGRNGAIALVQNPDDRDMLQRIGIVPERIALIPGSGVDTDALGSLPEPPEPITVGFAGRLLEDKGVRTLVTAQRILRKRGRDVRLLIAGTPDPLNPRSLTKVEVDSWQREPGVHWLGHIEKIQKLWSATHIAVLASRREGLPKSLLEAASCGRAIIATDVPGCREIVRSGETGLLVPVDDPPGLASAIERLASDPQTRQRYGAAARKLVEERFSNTIIARQTEDLYRSLSDPDPPR